MCLGWVYCTIGMGGEVGEGEEGKKGKVGEREGKLEGEKGKVIRDILHHKYYFC